MSLPNWTASVRLARAVTGIKTGDTTTDLSAAVEDAARSRDTGDWTDREDVFTGWVHNGHDIQPDR